MIALLWLLRVILVSPFKSRRQLEAENVALRHQVLVLRRQVHGRVRLTNLDRLILVQLYRWFPSILKALAIVQPETVIRWHRAGFRYYWRWKSRALRGRPAIEVELRALIRQMSRQSVMRSPAHPWRVAQARLCGRPIDGGQIHGQAVGAAQSGMAHLPAELGLRNHGMDLFGKVESEPVLGGLHHHYVRV